MSLNKSFALIAQLTAALRNAAIEVDPTTSVLLKFVYSDTQLLIEVEAQDLTSDVVIKIMNDNRRLPLILLRDKSEIPEIMEIISRELTIADAGAIADHRAVELDLKKFHRMLNDSASKLNFKRHHDLNEKTVFSIDLTAFGGDFQFATIDATPQDDNRLRFYQSNKFGSRIDGPNHYTGAPDYQGVYAAISQIKDDMIAQINSQVPTAAVETIVYDLPQTVIHPNRTDIS
jgi:hypothetical protein